MPAMLRRRSRKEKDLRYAEKGRIFYTPTYIILDLTISVKRVIIKFYTFLKLIFLPIIIPQTDS